DFYGAAECGGEQGAGSVFKVTTDGIVTTLHTFDCSTDGCVPRGGLIQARDGNFYGTTIFGGIDDGGTVFRMDRSGSITTLHAFDCSREGCHPFDGLIQASDGNFYGTADAIFRMTPSGVVTPVHVFDCSAEGCGP